MIITEEALNAVDQHWAVAAVGDLRLKRALDVANARLVRAAVGHQMTLQFADRATDLADVERVAMAYEVAAIEGLDALLHPSTDEGGIGLRQRAQAGAFRAYQLRRVLPLPTGEAERVAHVLHLAALAYCGDQWTDLRRWIRDRDQDVRPPSVANADWEHRVLYRMFDCWIRLLRKRGWDDLDAVREIVAGLREDQRQHEQTALGQGDNAMVANTALHLIALYHWAKATELLAVYALQGEPVGVDAELDKHFEAGRVAAQSGQDAPLDILLRWLHAMARRMVAGSLWRVAHRVNSRVTRFVEHVTRARSLFELLPPQRAALDEQGLLDQASRAVVVDLPTSGGKTTLAEFRILQALNQFDAEHGWVAYVAPTRALVAQLTRRLRQDLGPLEVRVEQLSGAVEVDAFEETLLSAEGEHVPFHVLVSTPEKLQYVIRNRKVTRPLALVVMDEAQNLEDEERGLRIELLLATIKRECTSASFLLLTPFVPNANQVAQWLGGDAHRTISIGTSPWQPNERILGIYKSVDDDSVRAGWLLDFETVTTTPRALHLRGHHQVGPTKPLDIPRSKATGLSMQTGAMAKVFSERGTSIAIAGTIPHVWSMARTVAANLQPFDDIPQEVALVQRFLEAEVSREFELIDMLGRGVGVHHAGLSDETRALIEWLAEIGRLRVLCATTTIAQGINFPVASVFLATRKYPYGKEMSTRAFWNLAGRAGRVDQESVGVVGLAAGNDPQDIKRYVSQAIGALVSRLVELLDEVERQGRLAELSLIVHNEQWSDFRCYVAHLWAEKRDLDAVLADTEYLLRNTFGFGTLQANADEKSRRKADALLKATSDYARTIARNPGHAALADATGFAPEGVAAALAGLNQLERKLTPTDWEPSSLFGKGAGSPLHDLIGVMMRIPEIRQLEEIGGEGLTHQRIAGIAQAWVTGRSIHQIADEFFRGEDTTAAITTTCKAIYRVLGNCGPWGLSALSKLGISEFDQLTDEQKRKINTLPAMVYHGVQTEAAVLMRMNSVPRSIAETLGKEFEQRVGTLASSQTVGVARQFLHSLTADEWSHAVPARSAMSGQDYRAVWARLSGEHMV